ncbi:MAG: hypothetical protein IJU29_06355 [Oscillospiraceae bacterium]|nr:hypothetical protein [Oscillospiraceae bacterium]
MEKLDESMEKTAAPKKRQRKPWTQEQKQAAAARRQEMKDKAENLKPGIFVQFGELESDANALVEAAKAEFRKEKKRAKITELNLYIKPEEHAAYFVINGSFSGKLEL